ncbi:MAG: BrnA antitoxin family protein [Bryobacterales bacterium]|nr:BrnA antitoxin family protein [Bryobacterales bacterium]
MSKLTEEKRRQLKKLAARPDREIDLTDIPEIRSIPSDAVIGKFYRPKKTAVTIRLDADILAWLKASGEGYQTRINAFLREMMQKRRTGT